MSASIINFKPFGERLADERRYLSEFTILSWKLATQMSDLTEEEIRLWRQWLNSSTVVQDFFDDQGVKSIQIRVWTWIHGDNNRVRIYYLIDMNAWPEHCEGEVGFVSLNDQFVLENVNNDLHWTLQTPLDLVLRTGSLNHLRHNCCKNNDRYDEEPEAHQHCKNISTRLKELGSS